MLAILYIFLLFLLKILYDRIFLNSKPKRCCAFKEKFEQTTTPNLKKYNVVISGCLKNIEKYVENSLSILDKIGEQFNKYTIVLYENDSSDKSREILLKNKKDNYRYILKDNVNTPSRTNNISMCRNSILDELNNINGKDGIFYDYLIMVDMDDVIESGKIAETLKTCFKYPEDEWDVMTGNQTNLYYDIYAYREKDVIEYDCWKKVEEDMKNGISREEAIKNRIYKHTYVRQPPGLIRVISSFGGIGVYKINSIGNCRYNGLLEDGTDVCEHVPFNECMNNNGKKLFINTEFLTN